MNMRKGDIITVKATVIYPNDPKGAVPEKICVRPFGHHSEIYVNLDATVLMLPFFVMGDRVRKRYKPEITGTVVATFDDDCWVDLDRGNRRTIPATDLEAYDVAPL
ncbi:hypothetical protein [Rhizobium arsenicireducens]